MFRKVSALRRLVIRVEFLNLLLRLGLERAGFAILDVGTQPVRIILCCSVILLFRGNLF